MVGNGIGAVCPGTGHLIVGILMSYGEQNPPDFEQNPYSAPHVNPHATVRAGTIPMPPNQTRGMVNQAVVVGVLMAVQGVLNCVAGVIAAFYAAFMPFMMQEMQQQQAQQAAQNGGNAPPPMPANLGTYFVIGGTVVAVVLIGIGILLIYSGTRKYQQSVHFGLANATRTSDDHVAPNWRHGCRRALHLGRHHGRASGIGATRPAVFSESGHIVFATGRGWRCAARMVRRDARGQFKVFDSQPDPRRDCNRVGRLFGDWGTPVLES